METAGERRPSLLERAAVDPRVALALGAVHAAIAIVLVLRDTFLNNEGIFSYLFAGMVVEDPLPVLFFLKSRPPIALVYALPSAVGFRTFAIVHALVASTAAPLTASLARAAGHARPNLAAALVAGSVMLLASGASGVGNADATVLGVCAATALFAWDRPALAGALAAILPLARAEMGLLTIALAIAAALGAKRARFFVGLAIPALVYAAAGAIYHHDPIWFVHFPPHVSGTVPFSVVMGREMFGGEPHMAALTLLTLTPAVGLAFFLRPAALSRAERVLAGFLAVFVGLLVVLPAIHPLNFGDMPRYVLPALPYLALLAARGVERLAEPGPIPWVGLAGVALSLVLAHFFDARHAAPALLIAVAGWSLAALVGATPGRRATPALVVALAIGAAVPLAPATRLLLKPEVVALGERVLEDADGSTLVLTNQPELPLWLAHHGGADLDVRHMQAADQRYEIEMLANEHVGQEQALRRLMRRHWYGPAVFAGEVEGLLRPGTLLALRDDARTQYLFDEAALAARSETTDLGRGRIVRVIRP